MPVCQFHAGFTVRENMQLNETAMYFEIIHQGPILQGVSNARAVQPLASYKVLMGDPHCCLNDTKESSTEFI